MHKGILKNDFLEVEYLTTALRISGLKLVGRPNLLVDLSDLPPVPTPYGDFYFRGGHRLWHAPEAMPRTYIPDEAVQVTEVPDGVILDAVTEPGTQIRKEIEIHLSGDNASLTVTHTLFNDGMWPVELAPWAITQFRLGGIVVLPMPVGNADPAGLLPNRQLSLWPYTRIQDPRLKLGDDHIVFKADALPPFKIGYFNSHGWMLYWLDRVLFRKTFAVQSGMSYPDNNCNCEMYCNDRFVELESLGALRKLASGESVKHVEVWEILDGLSALPEAIQAAIRPETANVVV